MNLATDPSATLHPHSGMICLLIQGSPPPLIPLSAVPRQSSLHSLPVLPPSDCRRFPICVTADFVHLTNYYIINVIIINVALTDIQCLYCFLFIFSQYWNTINCSTSPCKSSWQLSLSSCEIRFDSCVLMVSAWQSCHSCSHVPKKVPLHRWPWLSFSTIFKKCVFGSYVTSSTSHCKNSW